MVDAAPLKQLLKKEGAALVGIGDISKALPREIRHLNRGVAIAVNRGLNKDSIDLLCGLQRNTEDWLRELGFRNLSIPPDSDRRTGKLITRLYKLFCHKTAATCSGLGWIGKNGLIINSRYGSQLSWATVLTDAPLDTDKAITGSECGECELCVKHCPSGALKGHNWSLSDPLRQMVNYDRCKALKNNRQRFDEKPNCGLCVTICPYSRKGRKKYMKERA